MFTYKFVLMVCGIIFLFGAVYGMDVDFASIINKIGPKKAKKDISLKDKIDILNNTVKPGFFKKQFVETSKCLEETGQGDKYKRIKMMSFILAIVGGGVGFALKNIILVPILIAIFASIPFIYVKSLSSKYRRQMAEDLESGLSLITTSYLRNENIVEAVRENLGNLPRSIRKTFEEFVFENEYITPNLNTALNNMKFKINHPIFHEWINALIQCSDNKDVKKILEPIINKFATLRTVQSDMDTAMASAKVEAIIMAAITIGIIPGIKLVNDEWYSILTTTMQGKIAMTLAFIIVAFCGYKIVVLSRPIEYYDTDSN